MDNNYNGFPNNIYQQPMYQPNTYYQQMSRPSYQAYQSNYVNTQQTTAMPAYQQNIQGVNSNGNIIWVQGIAAAQAFSNLVPGVPVALWDSEEQTIYVKSIDQAGKPSMTILDYKDRNNNEKINDKAGEMSTVEYITKEQFDNLNAEFVTKDQISILNEQFSTLNEKLKDLSNFATKEQVKSFSEKLEDLNNQINDIEDRITSFGKPQNNSNSNNRRGNK